MRKYDCSVYLRGLQTLDPTWMAKVWLLWTLILNWDLYYDLLLASRLLASWRGRMCLAQEIWLGTKQNISVPTRRTSAIFLVQYLRYAPRKESTIVTPLRAPSRLCVSKSSASTTEYSVGFKLAKSGGVLGAVYLCATERVGVSFTSPQMVRTVH
jgi:hypothetical protein